MEKINATGWVVGSVEILTVGDLREVVAELDKYKIGDDIGIEMDRTTMWIELSGPLDHLPASPILCGDHIREDVYDFVIDTHTHEDPQPTLFDETSEFDWPQKDRARRKIDEEKYQLNRYEALLDAMGIR
jgi:hypothetical protein